MVSIQEERDLQRINKTLEEGGHQPVEDELDNIARQLISYLNNNYHPHVELVITPTGYELKEGILSSGDILDYVKD